jgi:serine/threonine-protein kinase
LADVIDRLTAALAGRYRVERELGAGGMATVYLAHDVRHDRKVAVKVLRQDLAASLGAERFHREIRIAAALQHPHILPLYDSGDAGGLLFYVMPYVEGTSLRQKLLREGELPITDAVRILRDVADALAAAHQAGVVHRDLKPENVMLSGRHALVTDFGVAKAVSESTGRQSLTTLGVALGTPAYMAPEQATADPNLDHRADLYAFGVMAYELLAGRPPFTGMSPQEVLAAHVTSAAEPVTRHRAAVPPMLSSLVMRCLEKRPADRWQSAEELIPQLEAVLTPSGGMAPTAAQPAAALARSPRTTWLVAGATLVLLVAIGAVALRARGGTGSSTSDHSIAVLPFESIDADSASESFILGVHGEIVTQLSKVPTMQVASRSSSRGYLGTRKTPREIAGELGVNTLLTGSVQRASGQVRFQVALDDASTGRQIWAESYNRSLTAENLFAIQGDVARQVANALSIRLSEANVAELSTPPTKNLAALDLYHAAEAGWFNRGNATTDTQTVRALERAVALDSSFMRAWVLLAQARSWQLRSGIEFDTLPAWRAVQRAVALAPGSLDARLAAAYYHYYARADYQRALADLEEADRLLPNSSEIINAIGLLQRRLGRWDDALASFTRASTLDRRSLEVWYAIGETNEFLGRSRDALAAYDYGVAISASNVRIVTGRTTALLSLGDTAGARTYIENVRNIVTGPAARTLTSVTAWLNRDLRAQIAATEQASRGFSSTSQQRDAWLAVLHRVAGNSAAARAYADTAEAQADSAIRSARRRAGDPFGMRAIVEANLAIALAAAGDTGRAIALVDSAFARFNPSVDAPDGAHMKRYVALVYALVGTRQQAIDKLRIALEVPRSMSPTDLRYELLFDRLRGYPEFQALVAR